MVKLLYRLLPVVVLACSVPLSASATTATVGVKMAEMRIEPSESAFSRLRLGRGRPVAVLGKSDDGRWVKVRAEFERADYVAKLEGWVEAAQVKGVDLASLSTVGGGSASNASGWPASSDDPFASPAGDVASNPDADWDAPKTDDAEETSDGESDSGDPWAEPANEDASAEAGGDEWTF